MKGFTLVELLAVIVILAVIALIATPIVLSIINDTKESAVIRSAEMYVGAVENKIMQENMKLGGKLNPKQCTVNSDGNVTCDGTYLEIEVNGDKPDSGFITYDRGRVTGITLTFGERKVITDTNGELVLEYDTLEQKLAPGLYDENDVLLASWDELINAGLDVSSVGDNANILESYGGYKLVIDGSVTSIGQYAFDGCSNLTSVVIPDSVTSIGEGAFSYTELTSVVIGNSVTSIGVGAFEYTSLTSVVIPNSVTSIGDSAFYHNQLTSVVIPNSVTSIGDSAFYHNQLTSVVIPDSLTSIGDHAFAENQLTSVVIPDSVTSIRGYAFSNNQLTSVEIPDSVTDMEDGAFQYNHLTNVMIGNGLTWIATEAFAYNQLTSVTIGTGLTYICSGVFFDSTILTTINYRGTEEEWNAIFKEDDWDSGTPENKVINYNYKGQ